MDSAAGRPIDAAKTKEKRGRGKAPYQWKTNENEIVPSWVRKIERLIHYTAIPFDKIGKALSDAGGPSGQTTSKLIVEYTGNNPGEGHLKNAPGKRRRRRGLERAARRGNQGLDEGDPAALPSDLAHASSASLIASNETQDSARACVDQARSGDPHATSDHTEHHDLPQEEATTPRMVPQRVEGPAKRRADNQIDREDKRRRDRSPRTSAAQIDTEHFVENLADLAEYESRPVLERLVNRWSSSSASPSFLSSTWSLTGRSHRRSSQGSTYQQSSHHRPQHSLTQHDLLQHEALPPDGSHGHSPQNRPSQEHASQRRLLRYDSTHAAVRTLRSLFALDNPWCGDEEGLADDIYKQLQASLIEANVRTDDDVTALHLAVKLGCLAVCGILLWAGADCCAKTKRGCDAYTFARDAQRVASTNALLHSRIVRCRQIVGFGLDAKPRNSHPLGTRPRSGKTTSSSVRTLRDLCDDLDPHPERKARRAKSHDTVPLDTIVEGQASGGGPRQPLTFSNEGANNPGMAWGAMFTPGSVLDSGYFGSPAANQGPLYGSSAPMGAEDQLYSSTRTTSMPLVTKKRQPPDANGTHQMGRPYQSSSVTTEMDQATVSQDTMGVYSAFASNHQNTTWADPSIIHPSSTVFVDPAEQDQEYSMSSMAIPPLSRVEGACVSDTRPPEHALLCGHGSSQPVTWVGSHGTSVRYTNPYADRHTSMDARSLQAPLQAFEQVRLDTDGHQQPNSQIALDYAPDNYTAQELGTPYGMGMEGDGSWTAPSPLTHPAAQHDPDEATPFGLQQARNSAHTQTQSVHDKGRILRLIRFWEDRDQGRSQWVSCEHNRPRNFDRSLCEHGCAKLDRRQTTEAELGPSRTHSMC